MASDQAAKYHDRVKMWSYVSSWLPWPWTKKSHISKQSESDVDEDGFCHCSSEPLPKEARPFVNERVAQAWLDSLASAVDPDELVDLVNYLVGHKNILTPALLRSLHDKMVNLAATGKGPVLADQFHALFGQDLAAVRSCLTFVAPTPLTVDRCDGIEKFVGQCQKYMDAFAAFEPKEPGQWVTMINMLNYMVEHRHTLWSMPSLHATMLGKLAEFIPAISLLAWHKKMLALPTVAQ